jgi:hypothetical protein
MTAIIGTSTSTNATLGSNQRKLMRASDGTWLAVYDDGSNVVLRTSSDGTTWSATTTIESAGNTPSLIPDGDDAHCLYRSGNDIEHRLLTFSGGSWSAGSSTTIATVGSNVAEYPQGVRDGNGVLWAMLNVGSGNRSIYYSTNDGATWTLSIANVVNGSSGHTTIALAGGYVIVMACFWPALSYRRHQVSGVDFTTWSSAANGPSGDNFYVHALADGTDRLMVVRCWNSAGGSVSVGTDTYDVAGNSWTSRGTIGAASDRWANLVRVGDDLYAVWAEYQGTNDYDVVYRKWDDATATWDAGPVDLSPTSSANRVYPTAGGDATAFGALWTEGTGSPYDVVFEVVSLGGGGTTQNGEAAIASASIVTASAAVQRHATATVAGVSTITARAAVYRPAAAAIAAASTITAVGTVQSPPATAAIASASTIVARATVRRGAVATIASASAITVVGTVQGQAITAAIASTSTIAATATVRRTGSAIVAGTSALAARAAVRRSGSATIAGVSTVTAVGTKLGDAITASLASASAITASATVRRRGVVIIASGGAIAARAVARRSGRATIGGVSTIAATAAGAVLVSDIGTVGGGTRSALVGGGSRQSR